MNFINICSNLLQHFIFTIFLLVKDYRKCALRKEPVIAPFEERFKVTTFEKSDR